MKRPPAPPRRELEDRYLARLARDERQPPEARARAVLIAHQRTDRGCSCGWGEGRGELGTSHAAHLLAQLAGAGLAVIATRPLAPTRDRA